MSKGAIFTVGIASSMAFGLILYSNWIRTPRPLIPSSDTRDFSDYDQMPSVPDATAAWACWHTIKWGFGRSYSPQR